MKISANAIKPGNVLQHDGSLWVAVKTAHVKPGKGGAFAQVELKNILDGRKLNERWRSRPSQSGAKFAVGGAGAMACQMRDTAPTVALP